MPGCLSDVSPWLGLVMDEQTAGKALVQFDIIVCVFLREAGNRLSFSALDFFEGVVSTDRIEKLWVSAAPCVSAVSPHQLLLGANKREDCGKNMLGC